MAASSSGDVGFAAGNGDAQTCVNQQFFDHVAALFWFKIRVLSRKLSSRCDVDRAIITSRRVQCVKYDEALAAIDLLRNALSKSIK